MLLKGGVGPLPHVPQSSKGTESCDFVVLHYRNRSKFRSCRSSSHGKKAGKQSSTQQRGIVTMALKNKYWVLRHGRSIPNQNGTIVSSLENGILAENGLAEDGIVQAKAAGELFLKEINKESIPIEKVRIYVSPFSRTQETAKAVASALSIPFNSSQVKVMEELRERYFGPLLELQSHDRYSEIWELDEKDPFCPPEGGESAADVAVRLSKIVPLAEEEYTGYAILVIAHGDPLQILQTILDASLKSQYSLKHGNLKVDLSEILVASVLSQHRKFSLLTGELRRVI